MATILVADDDDVIRRVLTLALVESGYRVIAVSSTAAALALEQPCDIALVDAYLDRRARTELPSELRRRDPNIRIVMMSGLPVAEHYPLADAVLQKPFSLDDLRAALVRVLNVR